MAAGAFMHGFDVIKVLHMQIVIVSLSKANRHSGYPAVSRSLARDTAGPATCQGYGSFVPGCGAALDIVTMHQARCIHR
jgi:hypothetical protein